MPFLSLIVTCARATHRLSWRLRQPTSGKLVVDSCAVQFEKESVIFPDIRLVQCVFKALLHLCFCDHVYAILSVLLLDWCLVEV